MCNLDQGHGRAAGGDVDVSSFAEGAGRGAGPGHDQRGGGSACGQDHRLREVQVSPGCTKKTKTTKPQSPPTIV